MVRLATGGTATLSLRTPRPGANPLGGVAQEAASDTRQPNRDAR